MVAAEGLHLARHRPALGEGERRLLQIPIGDEDRTKDRRQRIGEKQGVGNFEAAAESVKHRLHHRIGLIGCLKSGDIARVDDEPVEIRRGLPVLHRNGHGSHASFRRGCQ